MTFADLIDTCHVMVCCGTGGVGKTTTAATLAIEGARRGATRCVVTIDPAKRLANTLGLEHLSNTPREIPRSLWRGDDDPAVHGRLHALMLDTKSTFDQLVTQYAENEEQVERILSNGFYRNIAGALSGTQEYMAMEKLYELHASGMFELIVVDTPPTRHALDFLDAPLPADPSARQPDLPTVDGTDPHHVPRHQRRGAGIRPHGGARRRTRGHRRRDRLLPHVRRYGGGLP